MGVAITVFFTETKELGILSLCVFPDFQAS